MQKLQTKAYQKYIRQTPRKLRLVADMIRNLTVDSALNQLEFSSKRAANTIKKVITQAKANASSIGINQKTLKIKSILIQEGPTYKRWNPVSRGRAHPIMKRTSHIEVILEGNTETKPTKPKKDNQKTGKKIKNTKKVGS